MKNGIICAVLVLILAAGIAGGVSFQRQYAALGQKYEEAVNAAQAELDSAVAEQNGVTPLDSEDEEQRIAAEQELLAQAREEIERLNAEGQELDAAIAQAEQRLSEKQSDEEYAYYKSVYDSMAEGKALVESYLENH